MTIEDTGKFTLQSLRVPLEACESKHSQQLSHQPVDHQHVSFFSFSKSISLNQPRSTRVPTSSDHKPRQDLSRPPPILWLTEINLYILPGPGSNSQAIIFLFKQIHILKSTHEHAVQNLF